MEVCTGCCTDSSFYPKGSRKPLQGFEQNSNVTDLHFDKITVATVLEIDQRGARLVQGTPQEEPPAQGRGDKVLAG